MPKHLWNRVLKNPSNTNVKNLVYKAIKKGVVNDFVYKAYVRLAKERGLR